MNIKIKHFLVHTNIITSYRCVKLPLVWFFFEDEKYRRLLFNTSNTHGSSICISFALRKSAQPMERRRITPFGFKFVVTSNFDVKGHGSEHYAQVLANAA